MPGTGKTYTLQNEILQELCEKGYASSDIAVSTFTKSMAKEFSEEARRQLDFAGDFNWFSTTHSIASKLRYSNGVSNGDVMDAGDKRDFCREYNIPFSISSEYDNTGQEEEEIGNALFSLRDYCINNLLDPIDDWKEAYRNVRPDPKISGMGVVERFNNELESWKQENNFIEFTDMILECVENEYVPPVSVLIEDEFQDKSPLELKLFGIWSRNIDEVYIAGDPFQAIYGFKGTETDYMFEAMHQASDVQVLRKTYRFGDSLWEFSSRILERYGYNPPEIESVDSTDVEFISWKQYREVASEHRGDDCFHLVRSSHMFDDVNDVLRDASVIPKRNFDDDQSVMYENYFDAVISAKETADRIQGSLKSLSDFEFGTDQVEKLVKMAPDRVFCVDKRKIMKSVKTKNKTGTDFSGDDVFDRKGFVDVFASENPFTKLNETRFSDWYKHRQTLAAAYREGDELSEYVSHDVATIHSAKGKEADNVFLLNGSTKTIKRDGSPRDEARVFFVGATRASDNLYVVDTPEQHKFKMR